MSRPTPAPTPMPADPGGPSAPDTSTSQQPSTGPSAPVERDVRPEFDLETSPMPVPSALPATAAMPAAAPGLLAAEAPGGTPGQGSPVVPLRGDGGLAWRNVEPGLATVRRVTLIVALALPLLLTILGGVAVDRWVYVATGVVVAVGAWLWWLIGRQVSAISWIELPEELVIRRGRIVRSMVSIPYGRLQYIDLTSGPLMRARGLAACEFHTASPQSGGTLPGLTADDAEALRARLATRSETLRASL